MIMLKMYVWHVYTWIWNFNSYLSTLSKLCIHYQWCCMISILKLEPVVELHVYCFDETTSYKLYICNLYWNHMKFLHFVLGTRIEM